ncbi:MAG: hypothetical protein ACK4QW_01820 [Alphaproteobacteria bacterium]
MSVDLNAGDFNIVDILNTGVTGFAFLMLFVGYRLLSTVQSKVLEKPVESFSSIEFFREWHNLVRGQLANTRYFMMFSALLFAGGIALLVYRPESSIALVVFPSEGTVPRILLQHQEVTLDRNGTALLRVRSDHNVTVRLDAVLKELKDRTLEAQNLRNQLNAVVARTERSFEVGF